MEPQPALLRWRFWLRKTTTLGMAKTGLEHLLYFRTYKELKITL